MGLFEGEHLFKIALLALVSPEEENFFFDAIDQSFQEAYKKICVLEVLEPTSKPSNTTECDLKIWDFNISNHSDSIRRLYFKDTSALILLLNIENNAKFSDILQEVLTIKEERELDQVPFPIIVIGNRNDTIIGDIKKFNDIFSSDLGIDAYIECNLRTGENVKDALEKTVTIGRT